MDAELNVSVDKCYMDSELWEDHKDNMKWTKLLSCNKNLGDSVEDVLSSS